MLNKVSFSIIRVLLVEQLSRLSIIHRLLNQSKFPLSKSKLLESSADIEYQDSSQHITLRTLSPQKVFPYKEAWYLLACCHLRSEIRIGSLNRFQPNVTVISPAVLKESVEQCVLKAVQKIAQGQYVTLLFSKMNRLIIQG